MKTRQWVLWGATLLILAIVTYQSYQREWLAKHGRLILLELAPIDPRSLIQGDYMRLTYALARDIEQSSDKERRGQAVVRIDSKQIAHFVSIYKAGAVLRADEVLLPFQRNPQVSVGPASFFFQEGQAEVYQGAAYGEMRLAPSGSILLVGLRDADMNLLGPPPE